MPDLQSRERILYGSGVIVPSQKFMIDENGHLAGMVPTKEKPDSEKILNWIKSE